MGQCPVTHIPHTHRIPQSHLRNAAVPIYHTNAVVHDTVTLQYQNVAELQTNPHPRGGEGGGMGGCVRGQKKIVCTQIHSEKKMKFVKGARAWPLTRAPWYSINQPLSKGLVVVLSGACSEKAGALPRSTTGVQCGVLVV